MVRPAAAADCLAATRLAVVDAAGCRRCARAAAAGACFTPGQHFRATPSRTAPALVPPPVAAQSTMLVLAKRRQPHWPGLQPSRSLARAAAARLTCRSRAAPAAPPGAPLSAPGRATRNFSSTPRPLHAQWPAATEDPADLDDVQGADEFMQSLLPEAESPAVPSTPPPSLVNAKGGRAKAVPKDRGQCPGCGAFFQYTRPDEVGFVPSTTDEFGGDRGDGRDLYGSAFSKGRFPRPTGLAAATAKSLSAERRIKKALSNKEFDEIVAALDPEFRKYFVYEKGQSPVIYPPKFHSDPEYESRQALPSKTDGVVGYEDFAGITGEVTAKESAATQFQWVNAEGNPLTTTELRNFEGKLKQADLTAQLRQIDEESCNVAGTAAESEPTCGPIKKLEDNIKLVPIEAEKQVVCQRCFNLRQYNRPTELKQGPLVVAEREILEFMKDKPASLVVVVVDLFDLPGSILPNLRQMIGPKHNVILVGNKLDLLPKPYSYTKLCAYVVRMAKTYMIGNLSGRGMHLISALKGWHTNELARDIRDFRPSGGDVYIVGRTNVGKSELVNAFLGSLTGRNAATNSSVLVTTSPVPGTTLNSIAVRLSRMVPCITAPNPSNPLRDAVMYDTPGITNKNQLIHLLNHQELKIALPHKELKVKTYALHAGRTLLLGAVGRIDYVRGTRDHILVTVYSGIAPHITNTARADELCAMLVAGKPSAAISVPTGDPSRLAKWPRLEAAMDVKSCGLHKNTANLDIVFSGLGWVSLAGDYFDAELKVWSPGGVGVSTRKPILENGYTGKVWKANATRVMSNVVSH